MFFHFIYPLSVVTFGFDRLMTVCLHIWNVKERERGIKNSDRLGKKKEGKVRGRTNNGEMEKRGKFAMVIQVMIIIRSENKIYCGMNGTLAFLRDLLCCGCPGPWLLISSLHLKYVY